MFQKLTDAGGGPEWIDVDVVEEALGLPIGGPASGLLAEIFALVSPEKIASLEIVLTRSGNDVRVETTPVSSPRLSGRIRAVAEKHLSATPDGAAVKLTVQGNSVVMSSSSSPSTRVEEAEEVRPRPRSQTLTYIPLEPEPLPED